MRRTRLPRDLSLGGALLALLAAVALVAPLVATNRPWLARTPSGGLAFPALREALGLSALDAKGTLALVRAPVPHDPQDVDLGAVLRPPSRSHLLGTDGLGRDLLSRVLHGARVSLGVGLLSALLALLLGAPLGALAGYRGGATDACVSRVVEAVLCFPSILLALAVLAAAPGWLRGLPDAVRIAIVIGATAWTPVARYLRAEFLKLRSSDMVAAARASGSGHLRIAARHILPSAMAPVLVTSAFTVGAAILLEATLSFLGLGVAPPTASWGGILTEARAHVETAWWLALFPGSALFLAVLACNLLGEGIRDLVDPRARRP